MARLFETEMLPSHRKLTDSLNRFVDHKEEIAESVYANVDEHSRQQRGHVRPAHRPRTRRASASRGTSSAPSRERTATEALGAVRLAAGARDELMGMVVHDLRNPLGAITR